MIPTKKKRTAFRTQHFTRLIFAGPLNAVFFLFNITKTNMYARFRSKSSFYKRSSRALSAYGVTASKMRSLQIKDAALQRNSQADEVVDMRARERLEMLEAIRHPRERDFYQDHTYHNQWVARDLELHQKKQLARNYKFMKPDFVIKPWIWFPGDTVEVVQGESRGQRGTIIAVVQYKNEIVVQNVNVRDVTIPATETRPEQIVQREHPIDVLRVAHVDPTTNEPCVVRMVTVKNKETGKLEEKRISMTSGVLLPIPPRDDGVDVGDPLKDTPLQDADEQTYDAAAEQAILVQRKLKAMEDHFVQELKKSYEFHHALERRNAADMQHFQKAVVYRASELIAARTSSPVAESTEAVEQLPEGSSESPLPSFLVNNPWLMDEVEPEVDRIQEERSAAAAAEQSAAVQSPAAQTQQQEGLEGEEEFDEEAEDDEDENSGEPQQQQQAEDGEESVSSEEGASSTTTQK